MCRLVMGWLVLLTVCGCATQATSTPAARSAPPETVASPAPPAAAPAPTPSIQAAVPAAPAAAPAVMPSQRPNKSGRAASAAPRSPPPPAAAAKKPATPPPTAPLDLAALEQRLRDTRAIGVFTKLSLKNQVDDLLSALRIFYRGSNKSPTPELRQRYDLLLLKVLNLLQDSDPPLAADISSSREAIWGILADPDKFAKI